MSSIIRGSKYSNDIRVEDADDTTFDDGEIVALVIDGTKSALTPASVRKLMALLQLALETGEG